MIPIPQNHLHAFLRFSSSGWIYLVVAYVPCQLQPLHWRDATRSVRPASYGFHHQSLCGLFAGREPVFQLHLLHHMLQPQHRRVPHEDAMMAMIRTKNHILLVEGREPVQDMDG